jgi:alkaline phosphatase D
MIRMDSTRRHILDLSRRGLLRGAAGLAALAAIQPAASRRPRANPHFGRDPFRLGVASGDPWPDSVVLWTRLAPEPLTGGGMPPEPVEVAWEVAEDDAFRWIVARGTVLALPERAHAVHAEPAGLRPGTTYHYRFHAGAATSPTGRTRTAPAPDTAPARLRIVNAGCQNYEHGFFTAWRHVAEEAELDLVFHYGDYIYEYARREIGSRGWGQVVRSHEGAETIGLEQYRQRHAQYRLDPDLQAAHAAHPFAVSFDDHEVQNNWAGPVSYRPHGTTPERFALRKAAAFQAWSEHMPVRRATWPRGPEITAYRSLRFGRLASLHVLDTRSFRDDQPCHDQGGLPCPEVTRPDAQMLGQAQEAWLDAALARAEGWQVLAQQVPLMPNVSGGGGISMDKWDAYPAARARLLGMIAERRLRDVVVLSGDVHQARAGTLGESAAAPALATEFVGTSVSSEGDGAELPRRGEEYLAANPHLAFMHGRRGYTLHEIGAGRMDVTFRSLPFVSRPGAPREDAGRFVVESGRAEVTRA